MEEEETNKNILSLALEIIYLLTGVDYMIVKKTSDEQVTHDSDSPVSGRRIRTQDSTKIPSLHCLKHNSNNTKKKILEVTNKIVGLLMEEVPVRCQDVAVHFSMEEWQYIEGHKDMYKDAVMEDQAPLPSDGSSNRNLPERCPSPLYSQDSAWEDKISLHYQADNLIEKFTVEVKEEETYVKDNAQYKVEEIHPEISTDSGDTSGTWGDVKATEEEETHGITKENYTDRRYHKNITEICMVLPSDEAVDDETIMTDSSEDTRVTPNIHLGHHNTNPSDREHNRNTSRKHPISSAVDVQNEDDMSSSSDDFSITPNIHTVFPCPDISPNPSTYEVGAPDCLQSITHDDTAQRGCEMDQKMGEEAFPCSQCERVFPFKSALLRHKLGHKGEKPFSCSACGKCFQWKHLLIRHQRSHTGDKPFSCSECGKCFVEVQNLITHQKMHTDERAYSCSECGRCFKRKLHLDHHQIVHMGNYRYSCSECGRGFSFRSQLIGHQNTHTREKP